MGLMKMAEQPELSEQVSKLAAEFDMIAELKAENEALRKQLDVERAYSKQLAQNYESLNREYLSYMQRMSEQVRRLQQYRPMYSTGSSTSTTNWNMP